MLDGLNGEGPKFPQLRSLHQDVVEKRFGFFGFFRVTRFPVTRNIKSKNLWFLVIFTQIKKTSIKIR